MIKPLLVGEANPYGGDPRLALFPHPKSSAGYRLARLILAMSSRQAYLDTFDRVNLCPEKWSQRVAREHVKELRNLPNQIFVLLGAKVCKAFGHAFEPFTVKKEMAFTKEHDIYLPLCGDPDALSTLPGKAACFAREVVILPHPSGLSRAWNEPGAFERARVTLRLAGVLPPVPACCCESAQSCDCDIAPSRVLR